MGAAAKPKVGYTARPALLPAAASTLRKPALAAIGGVGTLLAVDLLTVYSCYRAGYELRAGVLARLPGLAPHGEMIGHEAYLFFVSIYLLVFGFAGLYHRRVSAVEESVI